MVSLTSGKNCFTYQIVDGYKRHDLVWINDAGREYVLSRRGQSVPPVSNGELRTLLYSSPSIPAIVSRQEAAEAGPLRVGFSFPRIIDGLRLRLASAVPPDCVLKRNTPFDLARGDAIPLPVGGALAALMEAGARHHTRVGCFGSAALQLATGLPYLNHHSDLDVYLRHEGNREELELFFQSLLAIEQGSGVKIDAEIEYLGQYGVKLKELFGKGTTVMGKGLAEVVLLPKTMEACVRSAD
jgi:phosphoribosyl-dephospho-CoA transferase